MGKIRYQSNEYVWILCVLVVLVMFWMLAKGATGNVPDISGSHPCQPGIVHDCDPNIGPEPAGAVEPGIGYHYPPPDDPPGGYLWYWYWDPPVDPPNVDPVPDYP